MTVFLIDPWKYPEVEAYREKTGDRNFCTVLALQNATNINFHDCLKIMENFGRKPKRGMFEKDWKKALDSIKEFTFTKLEEYSKEDRITINQFIKKHPTGTYYVASRGHAYTIKDGILYDYKLGLRRRLYSIYKVEKVE